MKLEWSNTPGFPHTFCRTWLRLEKQRGKLGMTWRLKVQGVIIALLVLGALAMAAGAQWTDGGGDFAFFGF
jgi:hypothetical protein